MRYNKSSIVNVVWAVLLGVFILGASSASSANYLKDINVQKAGDSVVVVVTTSETGDFEAFLTTSKPERIVIDLKGVVNSWSAKKYMELPCKSISSVRTSQFKPNPNPVARVVLDIGRPVEFRSFRNGNDVVIKMKAVSDEIEFASWFARGQSKSTPAPVVKAEKKPEKKTVVAEKKPATPKKKAAGVKIESSPKRKVVRYRTASLRDPFISLVGGSTGHLFEGLPTLENLSLVGILEDAEGNGYILQANDKVKNGYLVSVTEGKAVFQITEYGWTRTVALELDVPEIK
jgi:hypothetical protein